MTGLSRPCAWPVVWAVAIMAGWLVVGISAVAANRPIAWLRASDATLERELNAEASRGLRFAAASDGLPGCSILAMQPPEARSAAAEYRVVRDKDVAAVLDQLVDQGFVPRSAVRGIGTRHDVIFERTTPARPTGSWRLVEFEKVDDLQSALAPAAEEGYRAALLVRPAFRSWPGLSERGMVLTRKAPGSAPADVRVHLATKKNVDALARDVSAQTSSGWQFDLLFAHTGDGGPRGRRERAAVVLSKPRAGGSTPTPVQISRRSSFGIFGDVMLGAAAYWDEILVASVAAERRQAWASPVRVGVRESDCGPLGFGFRVDAPSNQAWSVVGLVATPATTTGRYDLLIVSDHDMTLR